MIFGFKESAGQGDQGQPDEEIIFQFPLNVILFERTKMIYYQ